MFLYRWLLRLWPASVRRDYGQAMEETFARRLADARGAGGWRFARLWLREIAGLSTVALSERWGSTARERRRRHKLQLQGKAGRMNGFTQEIRHAVRRLARSPAFTGAAVLTLALAIAANVSMFAVVQRVVLNPLPYPRSDCLIELDHGAERLNLRSGMGLTLGLYLHYSERARTLDRIAIYRSADLTLTGTGEPERIRATRATPSLASVLQVPPVAGRWFSEAEGVPGAPPVAVLSHGLWMRRFGGDPGALGRSVTIDGVPSQVVGIMPQSFAFPDPRVDLWLPEPVTRTMGFGLWTYRGVARLREESTVERARRELNGLIADLPAAFAGDPLAQGNLETRLIAQARSLKEATVGGVERTFWILFASVSLVLLVACTNVANLILARAELGQREAAVRRALGASSGRMLRYFFTESLLLAGAGATIGLAAASGAVRLLVRVGPATLPRLHEIRLDGFAVAFGLALAALMALAFGLIPLWRRPQIPVALRDGGRSSTVSAGRHRARQLLMGSQVALALVLVVAAGLMIRSFQRLRALDPGFDASSALTFDIGLPDREYQTIDAAVAAHHAILDRLSALPGVTAVSASTCLPLAGLCGGNTLLVEGRVYPSGKLPPLALFTAVAGGYFEAIGTRIVRGRGIDRGDVVRRDPVAVVNQALADRLFPNEDPIGRRIASNLPPPKPGAPATLTWLTIVGVAPTTPVRTLGEPNPLPLVYMPMSVVFGGDSPGSARIGPRVGVMSYVARTPPPPQELAPLVRRAVDSVDPKLAIARLRTLQDILDRASAQMAFTMTLLAIAAAVALVLGVLGVYGVMSYIVSQRTSEIGVRLALGADPRRVAVSIVRQGGLVALAGIAVGLGAAWLGGRAIASLLYGVGPRDPAVLIVTALTLLGAALLACWLPARRAARLDPLEALRAE
jgi:putative ABC transport system permease protein